MLTVQKRNGRIEPLDISKIQKYTSSAVQGLDNVSQSELEVDAKIQFRDKITTEEIQKTLIKTAVDKIDIDRPNWTYVAARLFYTTCTIKSTRLQDMEVLKSTWSVERKRGVLL